MKAGNSNFLINPETGLTYDEDFLLSLEKTGAKEILRRDLEKACHIDQEDDVTLDEIIDLNQEELSEALSYLQLSLIFLNLDDGEGSQSRFRAKYFEKKYSEYKARFPFLMKREDYRSYNDTGALTIG